MPVLQVTAFQRDWQGGMSDWREYKGNFSGRIFLAGNGPSLLRLTRGQLTALRKEHIFVGSRFYEWDKPTFKPSFYIVTEAQQATTWLDGRHLLPKAAIARFWVEWQPPPQGWVGIPKPPSHAHDVLNYGLFGGLEGECQNGIDPGKPHLHHGKCTPLAMLQVAKMLGFTEYYLIGCEGTPEGEVYNLQRQRTMHAPGIERQYFATAADVLTDCTLGGTLATDRGGPLSYRPLDEVLGI